MTTRIHCDNDGCDNGYDDGRTIVGDWRQVRYISDTYGIGTDIEEKHFCSLPCLARWASEQSLRELVGQRR